MGQTTCRATEATNLWMDGRTLVTGPVAFENRGKLMEGLWHTFSKKPLWAPQLEASSAWAELLGHFPKLVQWTLAFKPQLQESGNFTFGTCYTLEALLGSVYDGKSTFSTTREVDHTAPSEPDVTTTGLGGFEIKLFNLWLTNSGRRLLKKLTGGAIDTPKLRSSGRDAEFYLSGLCTDKAEIDGPLLFHVRWWEDQVFKSETLPFEDVAS